MSHPPRDWRPRTGRRAGPERLLLLLLGRIFLLGRIAPVLRCAGPRGADEQLLAVRQGHVAPVRDVLAVLGPISVDHDFDADRNRVLVPASPEHRVRSTGL